MLAPLELLHDQPLILLALLLGLGAALGNVRVKGVALGPGAVLFAALAVAAFGDSQGVELKIPELIGTFGLVLFTYTVGVVTGPQFFASLRTGWQRMVSVLGAFGVVAAVAYGVGRALGIEAPTIAGAFAGALTNTPALAAAAQRSGDAAATTVGYSITYLFGVIGMLLAAAWMLQRHREDDPPPAARLRQRTIRIELEGQNRIEDLEARYDGLVAFTRVKHRHAANPTQVLEDEDIVGFNDLVLVVGPEDVLDEVTEDLGHRSSHDLLADRTELDYRRVTVSNQALAGRTLAEIDLDSRFGASISRIRRGDVDLLASPDFVLQMGDRVRVIAPTKNMSTVSGYLGDSDRGMSDINVGGLALGLGLGLAFGLVHVPLPGGGFTVGAAAGTLIAGLVLGRVGRIGPVLVSMSNGAATSLSSLGMVTFLAFAGTRAGGQIVDAVSSSAGWRVFVLGLIITSLAVVLLGLASRRLHGLSGVETAGTFAGAQTQPAVLAFAQERTGFDSRVGVAYAVVYPAAMIAKIMLAQVLAGL